MSMDFEDDNFPSSLPTFQSSPQVFQTQEMTDPFDDGQENLFESPGYPYGSFLDTDFSDGFNPKTASHIQAPESAPPDTASTHDFIRDSPSTSLDTSDSSSGGVSTEDHMAYVNTIHIPADLNDHQDNQEACHVPNPHQNGEYTVNQWFDIDSAAGSPTNPEDQIGHRSYNLPHNLAHRPALGFGVGPFEHNTPMTKIDALNQQARRNDQKTVSGPQIENVWNAQANTAASSHHPTHTPAVNGSPQRRAENAGQLDLHISTLPRTQRVETQMHVTLTLPELPPRIESIRFQKYALARQKLLKKDSKSSPSTLELYAHCVCDTAMKDPAKRQRAFNRAASLSFREDSSKAVTEKGAVADFPREPLEGGFVSICGQCIQRETKRASRKKQEDEGHEEWLKDQPKRIIVFNRDELMDWKDWRSFDEGQKGHHFPDTAVQVRFPMRIQCYSRHHNDKDGYRVIFTIKDFNDRLIAQAISSPSTITDDHKAQTQNKSPTEPSTGQPESYSTTVSPITSALISARGANLNRNSYSTPDLSRLPFTHQVQTPNPRANWRNGRPPSLHGSRPPSPTIPPGHHNKKRKGSGVSHNRIRSDLAMTPFHRNMPRSPPGSTTNSTGPLYLSGLPQPMGALNYNATFDHSASASIINSNPSTPGGINSGYHQRSQSVENFAGYREADSVVSSAWHSEAPSAESSPQPYSHPTIQPQSLTIAMNTSPPAQSSPARPMLHKVTPTEGPALGGIEVTCLGDGFTPESKVYFGEVSAARTSFWSPAALLCTLPAAASPGFVNVTIRNPSDNDTDSRSQDQIYFKYNDNSEENMMRHTLALLNQQFTGGSIEAREFTQKLLSSFGTQDTELSMNGFMSPSNSQNSYPGSRMNDRKVFRDLEDAILSCLELIDLDEKPNQVDINRRDLMGQSILHLAAYRDYYRVTAGLLARGADVDIRDGNGLTPMHLASLRGNAKVIRKLQSSGADSAIRSLDGRRPSDLAPIRQTASRTEEGQFASHFASRATQPLVLSRASSPASVSKRVFGPQNAQILPSTSHPDAPVKTAADEDTGPPCVSLCASESSGTVGVTVGARDVPQLSNELVNPGTAVFAANPAVFAWKDQLSAQIHQLQHNLQRALPLMPTLPDYQAYPVMRRISNLVPQRMTKADERLDSPAKLKEAEYNWWDLFTGPNTLPPAYEEIYPSEQHDFLEGKIGTSKGFVDERSTNVVASNSAQDREAQYTLGKVDIGSGSLTKQQRDKIREMHARRVKQLGNDRKLFFIWIPLLLLILVAMLFDRASDLMRLSQVSCDFIQQQIYKRCIQAS